jgi:hypothetical protein
MKNNYAAERSNTIKLASRLGTLAVTIKAGRIDSLSWDKTVYPGELDFEFDLGCLLQVIIFEPDSWNTFIKDLKDELSKQGVILPKAKNKSPLD